MTTADDTSAADRSASPGAPSAAGAVSEPDDESIWVDAGAVEADHGLDDDLDEPLPLLGPVGRFRLGVAIACAPIIYAVLWAIAHKEWFAGDRSIMGVFTQDVFSRHTPLLGTVSTMGNYSEHADAGSVHHLGPAQFWALSIPNLITRGHPAGLLIGALLINCGSVVLTAWFIRRRLGTTAAIGGLLVCTVLAYGLGPTLLRDIWTPFLGLWPLLALVVLAWSLIDGDQLALPWAALLSGFLAQIELMFVGPALVLTLTALAGFATRRIIARRAYRHAADAAEMRSARAADAATEGRPFDEPDVIVPAQPKRLGWTLISCEVIALLMWWPVIYDELTGNPGNLTKLIRAMQHGSKKAGPGFIRHNVVAQLQIPPVWIRRAISPFQIGQAPSTLVQLSAFAFATVLVVVTISAWRRRRSSPTVFSLLLTTYPVLLAGYVNLSITPAAGTFGLQYRRWLWPFGAFLWFAVIVGVVDWARSRAWSTAWCERVQPKTVEVVFLVLAALVVIPASIGQHTPPSDDFVSNPMVRSMWPQLHRELPRKSTYLGTGGGQAAFGVGPEIMRRLLVDGYTMRTSSFGADSFGDFRVLSKDRPAAQTLQIVSSETDLSPPEPPLRLLAAGASDGTRVDPWVTETDRLLQQVRGQPGFALDDEGTKQLQELMAAERDWDHGAVQAMLDDPTRAMFSSHVLDLQLKGHATSSPLTDDQAKKLLGVLDHVGVLAFLRGAPQPPSS